MIYSKDVNFPYPVLTNKSDSYENCNFILSVDLDENTCNYKFKLNYNIDSPFINKLLETGQAQLVLVIKSGDNKFFNLNLNDKVIEFSKSRVSLSKRTVIQMLIQSKCEINFKNNNDLNSFYNDFKEEIVVSKNSLLGFSNTVIYDGSITKPFDLFEKKINPNIKSDIKIQFGSETIIINYKSEELQFRNLTSSNAFNNPYIYMGLQKALYRFIVNNSDDEEVDLTNIDVPDDGLDFKLYNLMKKKMINEFSIDDIDEVIYKISDKILEKYSAAVRKVYSDGN